MPICGTSTSYHYRLSPAPTPLGKDWHRMGHTQNTLLHPHLKVVGNDELWRQYVSKCIPKDIRWSCYIPRSPILVQYGQGLYDKDSRSEGPPYEPSPTMLVCVDPQRFLTYSMYYVLDMTSLRSNWILEISIIIICDPVIHLRWSHISLFPLLVLGKCF